MWSCLLLYSGELKDQQVPLTRVFCNTLTPICDLTRSANSAQCNVISSTPLQKFTVRNCIPGMTYWGQAKAYLTQRSEDIFV